MSRECSSSDPCGTHHNQQAPSPCGAIELPEEFEKRHVHDVYDAIAPHFSATRYKPWPNVRRFIESLPEGSLVADVGCGNGKNMGLSRNIFDVGCDHCLNLLKIVCGQDFEAICCDALLLPYRTNAFDAVISIAVLHHFASPERRFSALSEMFRILRPGGRMLVYVWAAEQSRNRGRNRDVLINWEKKACPTSTEQHHPESHQRYYHLFVEGSLEQLVASLGRTCVVHRSYYDKENWCIEASKVAEPSAVVDADGAAKKQQPAD